MALRRLSTVMITALAFGGAFVPVAAQAESSHDYQQVSGVATGEARINVATLAIGADVDLRLSHIGSGTARFQGQGVLSPGDIFRAVGPFTITTTDGDTLSGAFTLNGIRPSLDVHPIGVIMTVTGGTGRFAGASGTLVTAPLVEPLLPFVPPVLFEDVRLAVDGYLSY